MKNTAPSSVSRAQLKEWDAAHVWHPFTPMSAWREEDAPIIAGASGFELIDTDGRRYLDGISSLWCNVHGHCVPEIDNAIRDQLTRVGHSTLLGLSSDVSIEFARMLVERVPSGLTRVFYSDSGATSVEVALKLTYQYHRQKPQPEPKRDTFVCVGNAYHGDTIGTVSVGNIELFHRTYQSLLFPTISVPSPVALRVKDGFDKVTWLEHCFQQVEQTIASRHEQIAGFVIEPLVQGAAGILVHPQGYLKHVRDCCSRYGVPLIVDEVAVGFGRTGTMFACEQEDVVPDLMCLAKGISGGYLPLAATMATDEIYSAFEGRPEEGRTFFHGHTYTGNALACAAGIASLRRFESHQVLTNAGHAAEAIKTALQPLNGHPHIAEIRQKGIMVGIELVAEKESMEAFPASCRMGHQVTLAARRRGVIVRPLGDVVVLMPAPGMPVELVTTLCRVTMESISEVLENYSSAA